MPGQRVAQCSSAWREAKHQERTWEAANEKNVPTTVAIAWRELTASIAAPIVKPPRTRRKLHAGASTQDVPAKPRSRVAAALAVIDSAHR